MTGQLVARAAAARGHRNVRFLPTREEILPALDETLRPGDVLVTMGAGDVVQMGEAWLAAGGGR